MDVMRKMESPYTAPNSSESVKLVKSRYSGQFWASVVYLAIGSLAIIGFLDFFLQWNTILRVLFLLAIPFYILTITFTIWIHPIICVISLITNSNCGLVSKKLVVTISSFILASIFTYLVFGLGFIITA